jgi:hypothetical protein
MNFPKAGSSGEKDVASILVALSVMKSEMTPLTVSRVLDASKSLEKIIVQGSALCDVHTLQEANTLMRSAQKLELAISEIQERMISLEATLRNNTLISSTLSVSALSSPDDLAKALEVALNGPGRDWTFAAKIIERFSFLYSERLEQENNPYSG